MLETNALKKEIEKLQVEARTLRLKKQNLEADINNLANSRFKILEDTQKAREEYSAQSEKLKNLKAQVSEENKKLAVMANNARKESAELDKKKSELIAIEEKNSAEAQKNQSAAESNREISDILKEKEAKLNQEKLALSKKSAETAGKEKALKEKEDNLNQGYKELADKHEEIKKDQQKSLEALAKADEIIRQNEQAALSLKEQKEKISSELKVVEQLKNDLAKQLKEAESKNRELSGQLAKNKDLENSLNKKIDAQSQLDKELKIRELRVAKLIRDKELDEELKKLEKEMKR